MKKQSTGNTTLRQFIGVLKNRQAGRENSLVTLKTQARYRNSNENDLLEATVQVHINELKFVIEELEQILEAA